MIYKPWMNKESLRWRYTNQFSSDLYDILLVLEVNRQYIYTFWALCSLISEEPQRIVYYWTIQRQNQTIIILDYLTMKFTKFDLPLLCYYQQRFWQLQYFCVETMYSNFRIYLATYYACFWICHIAINWARFIESVGLNYTHL